MTSAALAVDARNRAARTLLVGVAIDVATAVTVLAVTLSSPGVDWPGLAVVAGSVARTVVQAAGSYLLRTVLDGSRLPTPLPPAPVPPPTDPV